MNKQTKKVFDVFIVYQNHEVELANKLKELLEFWGVSAFYCRQDHEIGSSAEPYRRSLRENLKNAKMVLLLLSREFQWSKYCQAEAGATMTMDKRELSIIVPPVTLNDIIEISPVIEGLNVLFFEQSFVVNRFKSAIEEKLNIKIKEGCNCIEENNFENELNLIFKNIIYQYNINPSKREAINIWPSIKEDAVDARTSVVEHIKRSIFTESLDTKIYLVGISLKYSLKLITIALKELAIDDSVSALRNKGKKVEITLVHMNAHSHILRTINDFTDIKTIEKLELELDNIKEQWKHLAEECFFDIKIHNFGIDYIPPQLGICIDEKVFFSGHCCFKEVGTEHHLLVGEQEYIHYTNKNERGRKAISDFIEALKVYKKTQHNVGIALAPDSEKWIEHLLDRLTNITTIKEVIFITQTAFRFNGLIEKSVGKGLRVILYVQNPESCSDAETKNKLESIVPRMKEIYKRKQGKGGFEIFFIEPPLTFRAALIGKELLGFQNYVCVDDKLVAGDVRLIVTKVSAQFESLLSSLFTDLNNKNPGLSI